MKLSENLSVPKKQQKGRRLLDDLLSGGDVRILRLLLRSYHRDSIHIMTQKPWRQSLGELQFLFSVFDSVEVAIFPDQNDYFHTLPRDVENYQHNISRGPVQNDVVISTV